MSWAIRIIGRPGSGKPTSADAVAAGHGVALDDEETLRLHRGAATTVTHAERNVP